MSRAFEASPSVFVKLSTKGSTQAWVFAILDRMLIGVQG